MAFLRSVTTIGLLTLLSRVFGFIRDLLIASFLGAGPVADAFVVALRLPNAFRCIFAEGAMDTAFVPIYTRKRQRGRPKSVQDFVNHVFTILLLALSPLTALAIVFMPHIVALLAPGFVGDMQRFPLALTYSNITFGYLILISIAALQGGLLNANGRFAPYASAPLILNLIMITGFAFVVFFHLDAGLVSSWALIGGGFAQMLALYIACRKYGLSLKLSRPRLTADVKQFFKLVGPGVIGTGADQLNILISTIMASTLPSGAIAALYYADRLNQVPLGVIGGAVATALLPALTRHIAAKEEASTVHYFSRAVEITMMICLPSSLVLLLSPTPIVRLLFQHGVFDATNTRITAETLTGYALAIPGSVLMRIFTVRFFAHENTRMPVLVSLISIVFNAITAFYLKSIWQHFGIALSYTLTVWVDALLLWLMLHWHGYAKLERATWRKLPRIVLATAAMSIVLLMTEGIGENAASLLFPAGVPHLIADLTVRFGLSGSVYLAVLLFTGVVRLTELKAMLKLKGV